MNSQETAIYLVKKFAKHTTSVTKFITFDNAKNCAIICAQELQGEYCIDLSPQKFLFFEDVIKILKLLKIENL